ncbi:MAG: flagellar protein FlgN [Candidatus Latescibacterota bacterium]
MNEPMVNELVEIINEEVRLFNDLLGLLRREQKAIVEDDLATIEETVAAQQEMARQAHALESRRVRVVEELSQRLHLGPGGSSLGRLVAVLEKEQGEELGRMRETLLELNHRIRATSDNNAFLIRQSMRYTERCLDILTGQPLGRGMYGKFGRLRRGAGQRSVVNQTA